MFEAARVNDGLYHTSALAGFLIGSLIGAAVIFAAAAYAASIVLTGGATAVIGGMIVGMAVTTAGGGLGGLIRSAGEAIGSMCHHAAGAITSGSQNVKVNGRAAAHVENSTAACKDDAIIQLLAEGSGNIFINSKAAVRKDDKTTCDATVDTGSNNVVFGGGRTQYLNIAREISDEWRTASDVLFFVAGLAGGVFGAARQLGCFGLRCLAKFTAGELIGAGVGYGIEKGIEAVSGYFGNPVDVMSGQKLLTGEGDDTDFILPGLLPLYWSRHYSSENRHEGALGTGWTLPWEQQLRREDGQVIYRNDEGREIVFPAMAQGERWFCQTEQLWLARSEEDLWAVSSPFETCFIFESLPERGVARLAEIKDLNGNSLRFIYDDHGQLEKIQTSHGYLLRCHWQGARLSSVTCVKGGTPGTLVSYRYDDAQRLTAVVNQQGRLSRQFGWQDNLLSWLKDGRGLESEYSWGEVDGQPRIIAYTTNAGEHWQFDYDTATCQTRLTDVNSGEAACWEYNAQRLIVRYQDFDGSEYRAAYNKQNMPESLILPGERTIQVAYDALARPVQITDALKRQTRLDYHRNSLRVTRRQYPDGGVWVGKYDIAGRLLKETAPGGAQFRYHYRDVAALPERIDGPTGEVRLEWQRHGEPVRHTDCSGQTTGYDYDDDGNLLCITDAQGHETRYQYERGGLLRGVRYADGSGERLHYNEQGLLNKFTDAAGEVMRWQYNVRGQVVSFTDRLQRCYRYEYDHRGRLVSLDNANAARFSFRWDGAGKLLSEKHPDNQLRLYHYTPAGMPSRLVTQRINDDGIIRAERQVSFTHDAAGRTTCRSGDMSVTRYEWDERDRLLAAERVPTPAGERAGIAANRVSFRYDRGGRLLAEDGAEGTLAYQWDGADNLAGLTLPDGQQLSWLRYGAGHVSAIRCGGRLVSEFERNGLHREVSRSQGALKQYRGYDARGRRLWQSSGRFGTATAGQPRAGEVWRTFSYGLTGELTETDDFIRGRQHYGYDAEGRLTSFRESDPLSVAEYFHYDNADNRLNRRHLPFETVDPVYESAVRDNRLRRQGRFTYRYDDRGNTIKRSHGAQVQEFAYDDEDRLIRAWGCGPQGEHESRYTYDALGRRLCKRVKIRRAGIWQEEETTFVWQGMRLAQEKTGGGTHTYIYDPDEGYSPLARMTQRGEEQALYWFHTDINGTPLEMTDEKGQLRWSGKYGVWGRVTRQNVRDIRESAYRRWHQPLRYAGQYSDSETGLHYNTYRYYDPDSGRFTTQDPIGLAGGLNVYAYAPNPSSYIDPLGLSCENATGNLGVVQSRINVANGRTRFTPLRPSTGRPVSAGFDHVLDGHFDVSIANSRSVFNITPDELKTILQSPSIVRTPVTAIPGGQYVRIADVGQIIGTTSLKDGGAATSFIQIFTDRAGNLITTYPVKGG